MTKRKTPQRDGAAAVRAILKLAQQQAALVDEGEAEAVEGPGAAPELDELETSIAGRLLPIAPDPDTKSDKVVGYCAGLDQSDTDNAIRLVAHFGRNLRVLAQEKAKAPLFVVWTGTHWDSRTGNARATALAQRVGDRILAEIPHLKPSKDQEKLFRQAEEIEKKAADEVSAADKATLKRANDARGGLAGARKQRRDFAITSRNVARIENMLKAAAPHIQANPDAFNADPFRVATLSHTLRFEVEEAMGPNPAAEREDAPEGTPADIMQKHAIVRVYAGHRREDLISELVPVRYDPDARATAWLAFLEEFQPDAAVRRMMQVAFGLGLLGITVQKLFFHYGSGANGKSVCMEVVCRVLGQAAVTLPSSSFFGAAGQGGGATPDIARLHGRRLLRVKELPQGEDLREELVKELTGGEVIAVRDLFSGYFDFHPIFTAHMSGNNYPRITGTDNGIWRRMAVILWPKTIPADRQRDFEDVVSGFAPEHPGILNWLIEGVRIFLQEGLIIPESVAAETKKYRAEMDPTSGFVNACVREDVNAEVPAREFYSGYVLWCSANGSKPISETAFGRIMAKKYTREDGRVRRYLGITLVDLPENPSDDRFPEGYGG